MLRAFGRRGLVTRSVSPEDRRTSVLALTARGRQAFARLDTTARREIGAMLKAVPRTSQGRLVGAMRTIEASLEPESAPGRVTLRTHRPGDMGWVVERHGALYWEEYGWDERFEALVASIVAKFIEHLDAERARARDRKAARRRVHRVRPVRGVSRARPLDQRRARRGAAHLRAGRLHAGQDRAPHELRQEARRRDLAHPPRLRPRRSPTSGPRALRSGRSSCRARASCRSLRR